MNPAYFLLLLSPPLGAGVVVSNGFLCVHGMTINPALQARIANSSALQAGKTITPEIMATMELDQCR